jgi:hypothetical protein
MVTLYLFYLAYSVDLNKEIHSIQTIIMFLTDYIQLESLRKED